MDRKRGRRRGGFWAHPNAMVECSSIGEGTRVWAFSHVMEDSSVGRDCNIGEHVFVEKGAVIGDRVTIKNGVQVWDGVTIEEDVFVGPNVAFTNDLYPRSPRSPAAGDRYKSDGWKENTTVKQGASIGANATIVCGLSIGKFAMVGAGAVVTQSVPDHAVVVGVPATVRGYACACGAAIESAGKRYLCRECGRRYLVSRGVLKVSSSDRKP